MGRNRDAVLRSDNFSEEKSEQIKHRLGELRGFGLNPGKAEVIIGEIEDEDWANSWKRFYKPTKIGNRIVIKPSWEVYAPLGDEVIVELDPGMAFGTGTHETTSMCIMLIEKYLNGRKKVFDIGCGSGILGICAAKLGAEAVLCADFDEVACRVARENASINSVSETVDVRCGNLFDIVDRGEKAELIVANIIADVIIGLADEVEQFMAEDGIFISSGIIRERKDEVLHRFEEKKFKIIEVFELGEWCAIAATK